MHILQFLIFFSLSLSLSLSLSGDLSKAPFRLTMERCNHLRTCTEPSTKTRSVKRVKMLGFRVHLKHPVLPTTAYRPTRFHRPGPWNRVGCSWKCSRKQDGHEIAQKCDKTHFSFPVAKHIIQRFKNFKLFQNQFLLNPIHREGSESERLFAKAENVPRSHPHPGDFLRFGKRL